MVSFYWAYRYVIIEISQWYDESFQSYCVYASTTNFGRGGGEAFHAVPFKIMLM